MQSVQLDLGMYRKCSDTFKNVEKKVFGVEPELFCDKIKNCCKNIDNWDAILNQSGYVLEKTSKITKINNIPKIIHSIKGDRSHIGFLDEAYNGAWALPYTRALGGTLKDSCKLREWLKHQEIPNNILKIFHQETHDTDLDRIIDKTYHPSFFNFFKTIDNFICISPGYSIYTNNTMCRHNQLLNLARSINYFVRASQNNIPCVPSIGWNLKEDLFRISEWINHHKKLNYVCINCQTLRRWQYDSCIDDMVFIEGKSRPLKWIVFGGIKIVERMFERGFSGRIHLVTTSHIQGAKAGKKLLLSSCNSKKELLEYNYNEIVNVFERHNAL